jgi:hypothetical protein
MANPPASVSATPWQESWAEPGGDGLGDGGRLCRFRSTRDVSVPLAVPNELHPSVAIARSGGWLGTGVGWP